MLLVSSPSIIPLQVCAPYAASCTQDAQCLPFYPPNRPLRTPSCMTSGDEPCPPQEQLLPTRNGLLGYFLVRPVTFPATCCRCLPLARSPATCTWHLLPTLSNHLVPAWADSLPPCASPCDPRDCPCTLSLIQALFTCKSRTSHRGDGCTHVPHRPRIVLITLIAP